jgi:hypothetical protein
MQNNSTFSNEDRLRLIEMRFQYEISTCDEAKGDGGLCGTGINCTWCRAVAENSVDMLPEVPEPMITAEGFAREVDDVLGLTGPATGVDARVLATLRFYEEKIANFVQVGIQDIIDIQNLKEEIRNLTEQIGVMQKNTDSDGAYISSLETSLKLAQFDADNYEKLFNREAPFAALGRVHLRFNSSSATLGELSAAIDAARAALAAESEPEWSEPAPSGNRYIVRDGKLHVENSIGGGVASAIPTKDAAFVAALMGGGK